MAIIGEPIPGYVANQIVVRQLLHGSGAGTANDKSSFSRTDQQINLLNSNTAWVKLASGISVSAERLTDIGVSTSLNGMGLAKKYILHAGFSRLEQDGTDRLIQRQGFLPQDPNSSYTYGTYGYSPMPGILSADIKSLNRGSIKKATVRLIAHNKQQFDIIDLLYLRLGYTVLLEWGNSLFTANGVDRDILRETLLEKTFFNLGEKKSYLDMLTPIETYRQKYAGNYDGLLGKVSNFSWAFQPDGSYSIEITIISLGDVIESLKTNISIPQSFKKFTEIGSISLSEEEASKINNQTSFQGSTSTNESSNNPNIIEDNKSSNALYAMLWTWKWTNRNFENPEYVKQIPKELQVTFTDLKNMGTFIPPGGKTVEAQTTTVEFYYKISSKKLSAGLSGKNALELSKVHPEAKSEWFQPVKEELSSNSPSVLEAAITQKQKSLEDALATKTKNPKEGEYPVVKIWNSAKVRYEVANDRAGTVREIADPGWDYYYIYVAYKKLNSTTVSAENPIRNFGCEDCFFLSIPTYPYYLRFGALLKYLVEDIFPKIDDGNPDYASRPPIVNIDYSEENNVMFTLKSQVSLDPRVCLVRNDSLGGKYKVLPEIFSFQVTENKNVATPMNIYLNFDFITECISSNADERGDVNVYNFLKSICDGLNKALGGVNNLEPVVDENSNVLSIVDTTPIPGLNQNDVSNYILQLYGYKKNGNLYESNFVRKVDLKTAITPEYATMITVGATAGGYVKGVEATAFSKWNVGLTDRFKESLIPGNPNSAPSSSVSGSEDEAVVNYNKNYYGGKVARLYGFGNDDNNKVSISSDIIDKNISIVTEYNKYTMASNGIKSGGTIGFIPFKISFVMDGISGVKIYSKLQVDTRFLPKAYGDNLNLIVTGVNHKLANNDWETEIEATVIPKTGDITEIDQTVSNPIYQTYSQAVQAASTSENVKSCSSIPQGNGILSSERSILKSRNINYLNYKGIQNTDKSVIDFIRGKNEGGYFHPIQYIVYTSENNVSPKPGGVGMGASGETLWGEDRFAGDGDGTANKREFWSIVDKYSGFGAFSSLSLKYGKKWSGWQKWKSPGGLIYKNYQDKGWKYDNLHYPDKDPYWGGRNINQTQWKKDLERLKELKYKIVEESFYTMLNGNFKTHPELKNLILSDVRTRYMWYRARYNGPGYFQAYAKNLKNVWDGGERNIDKLICIDFTFRYNYNKGKTYEPDVKRMADYVIPNR